jgi:hypothetical protein
MNYFVEYVFLCPHLLGETKEKRMPGPYRRGLWLREGQKEREGESP